jgi:hypothetical protein
MLGDRSAKLATISSFQIILIDENEVSKDFNICVRGNSRKVFFVNFFLFTNFCVFFSSTVLECKPSKRKLGIYKGQCAKQGDYPYQVFLEVSQTSTNQWICGGSLIDCRTVITGKNYIILLNHF